MKKQKLLKLKRFKIAHLNQSAIIGKGDTDVDTDDTDRGGGGNSKKKSLLLICITGGVICP